MKSTRIFWKFLTLAGWPVLGSVTATARFAIPHRITLRIFEPGAA